MTKLILTLSVGIVFLFVFYAIIMWAVRDGVKEALEQLKEEGFFESLDRK